MIRTLTFLALAGLLPASPLLATTQDEVMQAELLPGWQTKAGTQMAALHVQLAPHWKTYWRSPGEAGIPPIFNWSGSENLKSVQLHWPVPTVFHLNGMQSVGYHDSLVLPIEVTARDPSKPVVLHAQIDMGVCNDICMPAQVTLDATLAAPGAPDPAIAAALKRRPATAAEAGLRGITCAVAPSKDGMRVTAVMQLPAPGAAETVVFEPGMPDIWVADATTERNGATLTSVTEMVAPSGQPFALDRSAVTVTVLMDGKAVEISGCPGG